MSDKSQKTEKPTPRRKREARREGNIAKSPEVGVAASLLAAAVALRAFAPAAVEQVADAARSIIGSSGTLPDGAVVQGLVGRMFVFGALPFVGVGLVFGVAAGVGQVGFVLSPKAAKPKWSNLSPKRGIQTLKPGKATWELAKNLIKIGALVGVAWGPVSDGIEQLAGADELTASLSSIASIVWSVVLRAALLAIVIAAADYAFARYRTNKDLKMTKDEVKREYKDMDGDPLFRAVRRRRAMEMSRNRLINVATADVVVTNPTHFAVALKYEAPDPAPRVVAKGTDRKAKKIRRLAVRHGVPIIEHRPLARALYKRVKVGKLIPGSLYEAAAVVLAEAYRRRGRRAA